MKEAVKDSSTIRTASKVISADEINATLDKIFDSVAKAIKENDRKVTLDVVDKTLNALFEAVNKIPLDGKDVRLPDFQEILKHTN